MVPATEAMGQALGPAGGERSPDVGQTRAEEESAPILHSERTPRGAPRPATEAHSRIWLLSECDPWLSHLLTRCLTFLSLSFSLCNRATPTE